jgi:EAL domain-containing protein (putative c-di-GMP-specific phosphodiesterase class I)
VTGELNATNQLLAAATQFEQEALTTQARLRNSLAGELRAGLRSGEVSVHYQPLVEVATRRAVGLEALVRWQHPSKGFIAPSLFIPLAEESDLILELGEFVLRTGCEQIMTWQREGTPVVPLAVNISAVQLQRAGFADFVRRVLRETGMQPQQLALEITESSLMANLQQHVGELHGLRTDGVGIEIDDFGTGYSSLSYLKQLPIDTVKIDRSFIHNIDSNPVDAAIVSAIFAMAQTMRLRVVAEGVETLGQLQMLSGYGCAFAQGYYFSKPLPAERCRKLLIELAVRPAFTETLRMQLVSDANGTPRLVIVGERNS